MASWFDEAILLRVNDDFDRKKIIFFFTRHHGFQRGCVSITEQNKYLLSRGVVLKVAWRSRSIERLGEVVCDIIDDPSNKILGLQEKMLIFDVLLTTIYKSTAENQCFTELYNQIIGFLDILKCSKAHDWYQSYIELMIFMLSEFGVPLQLDRCTVHGITSKRMMFICPMTGIGMCEGVASGLQHSYDVFTVNPMLYSSYKRIISNYDEPKLLFVASLKIVKHFLYKCYLGSDVPRALNFMYSLLSSVE